MINTLKSLELGREREPSIFYNLLDESGKIWQDDSFDVASFCLDAFPFLGFSAKVFFLLES